MFEHTLKTFRISKITNVETKILSVVALFDLAK